MRSSAKEAQYFSNVTAQLQPVIRWLQGCIRILRVYMHLVPSRTDEVLASCVNTSMNTGSRLRQQSADHGERARIGTRRPMPINAHEDRANMGKNHAMIQSTTVLLTTRNNIGSTISPVYSLRISRIHATYCKGFIRVYKVIYFMSGDDKSLE